ncbi:1-deoxy-D-xylulose 5-phosphate reductoisomerase [Candidatus Riesia sp. GBBU]|nr:1-deoxy-D-xylulose 5-phosphate reductoisomerase [Candidatus Riesia sp. GBBU]
MLYLTILGSTGSIGRATISIVKNHLDKIKIFSLVANKNVDLMKDQCLLFRPKYAAMFHKKSAEILRKKLRKNGCKTKVLFGKQGIYEIAKLNEVDQVISAITGIDGLIPTFFSIMRGKRILIANKETIVTSGRLLLKYAKKYGSQIFPIDSEHSAIFQILSNEEKKKLGFLSLKRLGISKIVLTGSGGPFLNFPLKKFKTITPNKACNHPNWKMGKKISVDSATMINKGFEYIEARYLFNASKHEVSIIIHPQSIIHAMVYYRDGSMTAQFSNPDMRIPISYSIFYPDRFPIKVSLIDYKKLSNLTFLDPSYERYPCLKLAIDAFEEGQSSVIVLNAANEISVDSFLSGKIQFTDIVKVNSYILERTSFPEPTNINSILEIDRETRKISKSFIKTLRR